MNPGPSPRQGTEESKERRKIALVNNLRQYATSDNLNAFYDWLIHERKISEETAKERLHYLKIGKIHFSNAGIKAYRLFAKFLESRGIISEDFANKILKELKVPRTNADLYVPTVEEIKRTLNLAKEYSDNVYFVYRIALESGARLSEIIKALKDPSRDICDNGGHPHTPNANSIGVLGVSPNGICYYPLNWTRGYKGVFYIFHVTPLRQINITESAIQDFEKRRRNAVRIKYVRKFVASKMAELGIPLDIIDFIQGRKPTRVLTQHYVSLFGIARENYKKYAEWLRRELTSSPP